MVIGGISAEYFTENQWARNCSLNISSCVPIQNSEQIEMHSLIVCNHMQNHQCNLLSHRGSANVIFACEPLFAAHSLEIKSNMFSVTLILFKY